MSNFPSILARRRNVDNFRTMPRQYLIDIDDQLEQELELELPLNLPKKRRVVGKQKTPCEVEAGRRTEARATRFGIQLFGERDVAILIDKRHTC